MFRDDPNPPGLYYVLNPDKSVRPIADVLEWSRVFRDKMRRVALTETPYGVVSTVFLGIDHQYGVGPPILFETMVFNCPLDEIQQRYSLYKEALEGHEAVVRQVRAIGWWQYAGWAIRAYLANSRQRVYAWFR